MKKKTVLTLAILSAVMAGSVPMTSQAADIKVFRAGCGSYQGCGRQAENVCGTYWGGGCQSGQQAGKYCGVYSGEDLRKILEEIGRGGCPDITLPGTPAVPDTETPTPEQPGVQIPGGGGESNVTASEAEQVVKLVNEERAKASLPALQLDAGITAAANVRAREIKVQFSHTRPNGSSYASALSEQGVAYRMSGENIAYGQTDPETVMNGWMNSSGHRANILNAGFQKIGVGVYQDEKGVKHWVQLFT